MKPETTEAVRDLCAALQRVTALIQVDTDEVVATQDHLAIIRHFDQTRLGAEAVKAARETLKEISDRLSREYVPDVMRSKQIKTITVDGVGRVTISNRFSASMLDAEEGMKWLRSNGHGGLIKETVNSQTLSAFAKELLESKNQELPPDIFKVGTSPFTSITKK